MRVVVSISIELMFLDQDVFDCLQNIVLNRRRYLPRLLMVDRLFVGIVDAGTHQNGFTRSGTQVCRVRHKIVATETDSAIRILMQQTVVHVRSDDVNVRIVSREVNSS